MSQDGRWSRFAIFSQGQEDGRWKVEAQPESSAAVQDDTVQAACPQCSRTFRTAEARAVHEKLHRWLAAPARFVIFKTPPPEELGPPQAEDYQTGDEEETPPPSPTDETEVTTSRRLKCKMCGEIFTNRARWAQHILDDHENDARRRRAPDRSATDEDAVNNADEYDEGMDDEEEVVEEADEDEYVADEDEEEEEEDEILSEGPDAESFDEQESGDEEGGTEQSSMHFCAECNLRFVSYRGLNVHNMRKHKRTSGAPARRGRKSRYQSDFSMYSEMDEPYEGEAEEGDSSGTTTMPQLREPSEVRMMPDTSLGSGGAESAVDIYPCKFCKERVFLTSFGLERHTKLTHPDNFKEVLEYIETLHREREPPTPVKPVVTHAPGRGRKGVAFARKIDAILAKEQAPKSPDNDEFDFTYPTVGDRDMYADTISDDGDYSGPRYSTPLQPTAFKKEESHADSPQQQQHMDDTPMELYHQPPLLAFRQHKAAIVAAASFTDSRGHGRPRRSAETQRAKYQSCETCGILINTENPKALENHEKAHKKNRELREELLRLYGTAWVDRVTCRECNLVFKDEEKLDQHRRNVHVRRRHFLCRFCGDVFRNMRDLNMHKERRHEAFEGHRRGADPSVFSYNALSLYKRNYEDRRLMEAGGFPEVYICPIENDCPHCHQTNFENCRELVRHILVCHDETYEPLTLKGKDYASFRCDMYDGIVTFACCDVCTTEVSDMVNHRQLVHGTSLTGRPQTCEYCGSVLTNRKAYDNHVRLHRYRQCKICHIWFDSTREGFMAYRSHMRNHREHGHEIKEVQINDIRSKETELLESIVEEEQWGISDDEYSVYTESGVESDVEDEEGEEMLRRCNYCDQTLSCEHTLGVHLKRHATVLEMRRRRRRRKWKCKPYQQCTRPAYRCYLCQKSFKDRGVRSKHFLMCMRRRQGIRMQAPKEAAPDELTTTSDDKKPPTEAPSPSAQVTTNVDHRLMTSSELEMEDDLDVRPKQAKKLPDDEITFAVLVSKESSDGKKVEFQCPNCPELCKDLIDAWLHCRSHRVTSKGKEHTPTEEQLEVPKRKKTKLALDEVTAAEKQSSSDEEYEDFSLIALTSFDDDTADPQACRYRCDVCRSGFADKAALEEHIEKHKRTKTYRCKMCRKRYWTSDGLKEHLKIHDVNYLYCQTCFCKFKTVESLKRHEIFHELTNSLYQCEDCSMSYCGFAQLQAHFKEAHSGIFILTCPICAQIHTDRHTLIQHLIHEHSKLSTKCAICDRVYSNPFLARAHSRRCHMLRGNTETCYACGKVFFDKKSLIIHRWRHLGELDYQCAVCDRPFADEGEVLNHLSSVHKVTDSKLVVNHEAMGRPKPLFPDAPTTGAAGTVGAGASTTEEATASTSEVVTYKLRCCFCFKRFEDRAKALKHLYRHHGFARRLQCQFCERRFCKSTALHAHMVRRHPEALQQMDAAKNAQPSSATDAAASVAGTSDAQPVYIRLGEDQQILQHFVTGEGGTQMQPYELVLLNGEDSLQAGLDASQIQYVQLPPGTDISQFKITDDPNIQVIQVDQGEYAQFVSR